MNHPTPDLEPVATPPRGVNWVFLGSNGLRAGWGVLLFVIFYCLFFVLIGRVMQHLLEPARHITILTVKLAYSVEMVQLLPAILATALMAAIERRSLLAYGYQSTARAVRFLSGLVLGFIASSALVLVLWKAHLLAIDGFQLHGAAVFKYALAWAGLFLLVAVFEESTLRGYLQFTLTRGIGFWWGALLLSLLFGLSHHSNPGETPIGLFSAAAIGLIFCLSLWYTGSLWWALGFHAAWDWAESYFYGTSDSGLISQGRLLATHPTGTPLWSGGTTGPEGSLLVVPLLAIFVLLIWLWWGRRVRSPFRGQGWRPAWAQKPATAAPDYK